MWADRLQHPCHLGCPHFSKRGTKSASAHKWVDWLMFLPFGGPRTLQFGGQNQKWPTRGRIGYITPAIYGVPNASDRGGQN